MFLELGPAKVFYKMVWNARSIYFRSILFILEHFQRSFNCSWTSLKETSAKNFFSIQSFYYPLNFYSPSKLTENCVMNFQNLLKGYLVLEKLRFHSNWKLGSSHVAYLPMDWMEITYVQAWIKIWASVKRIVKRTFVELQRWLDYLLTVAPLHYAASCLPSKRYSTFLKRTRVVLLEFHSLF